MRSVDLVEGKLRETSYFLERMGEAGFNVWAFYCDFTAFLSSARSVTFTLQAVMSGHPEWPTWYDEKRRHLLSGPRGKFMVEMRNVTQKVGDVGLDSGMGGPDQRVQHFFPPTLTAKLSPKERSLDALTLCHRHMGVLVKLIQDWLQDFSGLLGLELRSDWSGSFEELEADLGFPGGWTSDVFEGFPGGVMLLLGSPGEFLPDIDDLVVAYPFIADFLAET